MWDTVRTVMSSLSYTAAQKFVISKIFNAF